ncbi:hypothetical protein [Palleronia sp.]|uniref:hypothetical protein n=1 Tax=Palleronia sp. TaxID=1940284 RepID=UPI0035C8696E
MTANELHLPVGRRAQLKLESDNVIHSLRVPILQGKTDLIPGRDNELYPEPAIPGEWRGQCAGFCGKQHAGAVLLPAAGTLQALRGSEGTPALPRIG